jgi:tetratricopeptide (TPR) repeat protein
VQVRLALSSVTASEGRFTESEQLASTAVQDALASGLETIAADGLIDLAATLLQLDRNDEALAQVTRALKLAEQRGARRTTARAQVQLAAAQHAQGLHREALSTTAGVLPFLKSNRYASSNYWRCPWRRARTKASTNSTRPGKSPLRC